MSDLLNHISEKAISDYDHLRDDCGLLDFGAWALIEMTGEDRKGWLQGQVTNDLRRFESGASSSFCICSATGHIEAVVDGWALSDRFVLTCDKPVGAAVLTRARNMVIMEHVQAQDVSKQYKMFSIQGPTATRRLGEMVELPNLDAGKGKIGEAEVFVLRANRTGLGGWDIWVPSARRKAVETLRETFRAIEPEAYEAARLEAGVPKADQDYNIRTLAPEMGPAFEAKHISYTKGCYTGQEVIMRLHSRGHTNRTWVGLTADTPLEAGAVVKHRLRADAGQVTSAAFSPDYGPIGAAMLRNEVAEDREEVTVVTSRGEVKAEVRRMPILRLS